MSVVGISNQEDSLTLVLVVLEVCGRTGVVVHQGYVLVLEVSDISHGGHVIKVLQELSLSLVLVVLEVGDRSWVVVHSSHGLVLEVTNVGDSGHELQVLQEAHSSLVLHILNIGGSAWSSVELRDILVLVVLDVGHSACFKIHEGRLSDILREVVVVRRGQAMVASKIIHISCKYNIIKSSQ